MSTMRPSSHPGWWAAWCAAGFALSVVALQVVARLTAGAEAERYAIDPRSSVAAVMMAFGLGSLVAGGFALRKGDRSVPVWVALVLGALAMLLLIAEFTFME